MFPQGDHLEMTVIPRNDKPIYLYPEMHSTKKLIGSALDYTKVAMLPRLAYMEKSKRNCLQWG